MSVKSSNWIIALWFPVQECSFMRITGLFFFGVSRRLWWLWQEWWVWNKPCYFLPGCKVYGGDQTYVLLAHTLLCFGIRGGGHSLIQAGMTAEELQQALGNFVTSSYQLPLALTLLFLKAQARSGLLGVMCCDIAVDGVIMLLWTCRRGLSWWGAGTHGGSRSFIGKKRGAARAGIWHYWYGRWWLWDGLKEVFLCNLIFYDCVFCKWIWLAWEQSLLRLKLFFFFFFSIGRYRNLRVILYCFLGNWV